MAAPRRRAGGAGAASAALHDRLRTSREVRIGAGPALTLYDKTIDPKERAMIAEGILLIRRACPPDRTPTPTIPKAHRHR